MAVGIFDQAGTPERGVERSISNGGQRPGCTVAGECTTHGAAIAEKQNVGRLEEELIHGEDAFRRELAIGFERGLAAEKRGSREETKK